MYRSVLKPLFLTAFIILGLPEKNVSHIKRLTELLLRFIKCHHNERVRTDCRLGVKWSKLKLNSLPYMVVIVFKGNPHASVRSKRFCTGLMTCCPFQTRTETSALMVMRFRLTRRVFIHRNAHSLNSKVPIGQKS